MRIRAEIGADIPHIHRVNEAAFDSPTEANLVDALRERAADVTSLVAEDGNEVVGHIMFSPVRITGAPHVCAMALAPMAVIPERQRSGIGSELVRAGLAECTRLGVEAVFVVGHPAFYPRFGFTRASTFAITCEFEVADEAFMAIELVPGVLKGTTGTVCFHDAFKEA